MASYGTNVINFSLLKQYKSSFVQEKNKFNNTTYKTFSSSYLRTCSDSNIKRMSNSLDAIYKKLQKGYNSIDKWWEAYNTNAEGLENSLSNNSLRGITKGSLRSFVSANLIDLPDYKSNLARAFNHTQIVNNFNSHFSNNSVGVTSFAVSTSAVSKHVSDKKIDSYVSKINGYDLVEAVGTVVTTGTSRLNEWVDNTIEDVTGFFEETKAKVSNFFGALKTKVDEVIDDSKQALINTAAFISNKVKNLWNKFVAWFIHDALPWMANAYVVMNSVLESISATIVTAVISLVEGIVGIGETAVDLLALAGTIVASIVTGLWDGVKAIHGAIIGEEWSSTTKKMWEETMGYVSKKSITSAFDKFYATNSFGQWLATKTYGFDTVRGIGSGLGYVAGVVAISVLTFGVGGVIATGGTVTLSTAAAATTTTQMSIVAGLAGISKGTQDAWADGATILEGLGTGALTGVWEGLQFYIGGKIGQSSIFGKATTPTAKASLSTGKKVLDGLARVVLDGIDGGVEAFVQPLLMATYKDSYVNEFGNEIKFSDDQNIFEKSSIIFDLYGGWGNVGIQTAIGLGGSVLGEVFDLGKAFNNADEKSSKVNVKSQNTKLSDADLKLCQQEYSDMISSLDERTLKIMNDMEKGYATVLDSEIIQKHEKLLTLQKIIDGEYIPNEKELFELVGDKKSVEIKQPETKVKLTTAKEASEFFEDPKQFMVCKLSELCEKYGINSPEHNLQNLQDLWPLYQEIQTTPVNDISDEALFNKIAKYLTSSDVSKIKDMYSNADNPTNIYTKHDKNIIQLYTHSSGPALTAYMRNTKTMFQDMVFDGTSAKKTYDYIREGINYIMSNKKHGSDFQVELSTLSEVADPDVFIQKMDNIIDKSPALKEDIIVYRKVDSIFKDGIKVQDFTPGQKFNDPAYASCSVLNLSSYSNRKVYLEIEVPKGTKGAYIEPFTGVTNYGQQEFLLGRNQTFEITDYPVYKADGTVVLKAKVIDSLSDPNLHLPSFDDVNYNSSYAKTFSNIDGGKSAKEIIDSMNENGLIQVYNKEVNDMYQQGLYDGPKALAEHDYDHVKNVLLYSMNMAKDLNFSKGDMNILIDAAKYHDIGVVNANTHVDHSVLSANAVVDRLKTKYSNNDLAKLQAIIEYHEKMDVIKNGEHYYIDYAPLREVCDKYGITNENDINTVLKIGNVLKDADALDRTRFPGNIDVNYFRNKEAINYVNASYDIREEMAKQQILDSLNKGQYTNQETNDIFKLLNLEYPDFIVNFASKYYKNLKFDSIIECATSIMENKHF